MIQTLYLLSPSPKDKRLLLRILCKYSSLSLKIYQVFLIDVRVSKPKLRIKGEQAFACLNSPSVSISYPAQVLPPP